jgi:magnesium transporter
MEQSRADRLIPMIADGGMVFLFSPQDPTWLNEDPWISRRGSRMAANSRVTAGQGGNAGMQTLTVIIRDLALGELAPGDGRRVLGKEILLGLLNGLAVGVVVGLIGWWWKDSPVLGLVAAGAMVLNQLAAAVAGVLIPLGLKAVRLDPALASSIFLTTVTDVAGFFFFLGLATLGLKWAGL